MKERRFYVPESFERILEKMEEILRRDGSNLSKWIRHSITEYVRLHGPGNPQQRLERYEDPDAKAYVAPRGCGFCHADATGVLRFVPKNMLVPVCPTHHRLLCRSPNYEKTELKIGEVKT